MDFVMVDLPFPCLEDTVVTREQCSPGAVVAGVILRCTDWGAGRFRRKAGKGRTKGQRERGTKGKRDKGKEGKRGKGKEGKRDKGKEGQRERGTRGKEGHRERGTVGARGKRDSRGKGKEGQ
jgi:hypothetical protein